jgi:erythromycin esterase
MASDVTVRSSLRLGCLVLELLVSQILQGQETRPQSGSSVPSEVTAWFKSAAVPLDSTSPESGLDDLRPLQSTIGNARIVAMGEATHGTREFFQLKHRTLEFLVERMGFTVFGIEANWPESLAVNDYVLNGHGDPAEALAGLYFWTWNTEEVLDMIRWMRRYNQDPSHTKKVKFFGFDMQVTRVAVTNVEIYLQKVDRGQAKVASAILAPLSDAAGEREYRSKSEDFRHKTAEGIMSILARFESLKKAYVDSSSFEEWISARQNLEIVRQAEAMHSAASTDYFSARDRSMAKNVKWILDNEGPGSKIMLWAHNGHVSTLPLGAGEPMGMSLRRIYGREMVVCGFSFDHGSFQAIQPGKGLRKFTVGPAIPGSLDSTLAAIGIPVFAIDLRGAPSTGAAGDWLNAPQLMRSIGAVYSETPPGAFLTSVNLHSFDVIFFVNRTTAAHENPKHSEIEFRGGP